MVCLPNKSPSTKVPSLSWGTTARIAHQNLPNDQCRLGGPSVANRRAKKKQVFESVRGGGEGSTVRVYEAPHTLDKGGEIGKLQLTLVLLRL